MRALLSDPTSPGLQLALAALALAWLLNAYSRHRRFVRATPPGPRPIPFVGNVHQMPRTAAWRVYAGWAKEYDTDLVSIRAFGKLTIVINSARAARELLERRSATYSDRPYLAMLELMGFSWVTLMLPYGPALRLHRRLLDRVLNTSAIAQFQPMQESKAAKFVQRLYQRPKDFVHEVERYTGALSLAMTYGHDVVSDDDPYIAVCNRVVNMFNASSLPGAALVNALPILRHLPEYFPGATFHAYARACRKLARQMRDEPFNMVKSHMAAGTARPSFLLSALECVESPADETAIAEVAGTIFPSAVEPTASSLLSAIMAFANRPEVQKRAQAELDAVTDRRRLPKLSDRAALPYVEAVCRELLRCMPPVLLGFPHRSTVDDVYDGWEIPAGTSLTWNIWAITHDPETYPDPDRFWPERFLTPDGRLKACEEDATFGYGRRQCPGMHFQKDFLFIAVSTLLSVFTLEPAKDTLGNPIPIVEEFTDALISNPKPFECSIRPRDERAVELLTES